MAPRGHPQGCMNPDRPTGFPQPAQKPFQLSHSGWQTPRQQHGHSPVPHGLTPTLPSPPKSTVSPTRAFGKGDQCSALLLSPCQTPQIRKAKPSSEDMDLHRPCSFYSWHPQKWDLGRNCCQKTVTGDLIRQTAFNLISSATSTFCFL